MLGERAAHAGGGKAGNGVVELREQRLAGAQPIERDFRLELRSTGHDEVATVGDADVGIGIGPDHVSERLLDSLRGGPNPVGPETVSYTHLRAHETPEHL